jgi:flagellar hook-associated protein 1 FlgK
MGNLSIALYNAAQAQRAFDRAISVVQNNVTNVNTPGYARQRATFDNAPFNPDAGMPGGIKGGSLQSRRSAYVEQAVRREQGELSAAEQRAGSLTRLERTFSLNSKFGIPTALSSFFNSFSQLSVNPNDRLSRQAVLDQAKAVTQSIRNTATDLSNAVIQTNAEIRDQVTAINAGVAKLRDLNEQRRSLPGGAQDAGLDAQMYAQLEELSQYGDFQSLMQPDGSVSLYLGGRTPVLVGLNVWKISEFATDTATSILTPDGDDITNALSNGKLASSLKMRNETLPAYQAQLNTFAKSFADRVNTQLADGVDLSGASPAQDLFTYTLGAEAFTIQVTNLTPDQIAAASSSAPGGNGNALNVAALAEAKSVDGLSFSQYFGRLGAQFGRDLADARGTREVQANLLAQARNYRQEVSGVDLNEEAAELIQFQRAYQASAEMFRVLNQLTETVLSLLR